MRELGESEANGSDTIVPCEVVFALAFGILAKCSRANGLCLIGLCEQQLLGMWLSGHENPWHILRQEMSLDRVESD